MSFNQKHNKENKLSSNKDDISWNEMVNSQKSNGSFINEAVDLIWSNVSVPFEKTKEDLWEQLEGKIDFEAKELRSKTVKMNLIRFSLAAVLILLLCTTFFARFYTTSVLSANAELISHILPDGSEVELNAQSKMTYNPLWWQFSREVNLDGEAFFEVEKGSKFQVVSQLGTTEVLGTSFNILARNDSYEVFCKTGLVKVYLKNSFQQVFLNPNQKTFSNGKELVLEEKQSFESHAAWMFDSFNFNQRNLPFILDEIARTYDVSIDYSLVEKSNYSYTGYFEKSNDVENTIDVVCLSLGLKYEKVSDNDYRIK